MTARQPVSRRLTLLGQLYSATALPHVFVQFGTEGDGDGSAVVADGRRHCLGEYLRSWAMAILAERRECRRAMRHLPKHRLTGPHRTGRPRLYTASRAIDARCPRRVRPTCAITFGGPGSVGLFVELCLCQHARAQMALCRAHGRSRCDSHGF